MSPPDHFAGHTSPAITRLEVYFRNIGPADTVIPEDVMKCLIEYPWPRNVRELKNVIERLVLLFQGRAMSVSDLPEIVQRSALQTLGSSHADFLTLVELEREHIVRVLAAEKNQERAAKILGITTITLWRKRKDYGPP